MAKDKGLKHVVFGTNLDDLDDYRPGNRAMNVFGVHSPLAKAGLTKQDIRELSRQLELETADVPASPCLASRLAYGLEISEKRLEQIEQAEDFLRELGLVEFRVRHHDTLARVEVHQEYFEKITAEPNRSKIIEKLKAIGFKYVTIDLQGFRSGSMNETLSIEQKKQSQNWRKMQSVCQSRDGGTDECGVIDAYNLEVNAEFVFEVLLEIVLNAGF